MPCLLLMLHFPKSHMPLTASVSHLSHPQVRQIERRWALQEAAKYDGGRLLRTADAYTSAVGFVDASKLDDWRVLHLNTPAVDMLGQ